jgi:hypothetical protein
MIGMPSWHNHLQVMPATTLCGFFPSAARFESRVIAHFWILRRAPGPHSARARSHCRFVPPLTHFIPYFLTYSVPLFLKRECDEP